MNPYPRKPLINEGFKLLSQVQEFLIDESKCSFPSSPRTPSSTCQQNLSLDQLPYGIVDKIFTYLSTQDIAACWLACNEWRSYLCMHHIWRALHDYLQVAHCWRDVDSSRSSYSSEQLGILFSQGNASILWLAAQRTQFLLANQGNSNESLLYQRLKCWLQLRDAVLHSCIRTVHREEAAQYAVTHDIDNIPHKTYVSGFAVHKNLLFLGWSHRNSISVLQYYPSFRTFPDLQPLAVTNSPEDIPFGSSSSTSSSFSSSGIWAMTCLPVDNTMDEPPVALPPGLAVPSDNSNVLACYVFAGDTRGRLFLWLVVACLHSSQIHIPFQWSSNEEIHDRVVRVVTNNGTDLFATGGKDGRIHILPLTNILNHKSSCQLSAMGLFYDTLTGHEIDKRIHKLVFVNKNYLLSAGYDGQLFLWCARTRRVAMHLAWPNTGLYTFVHAYPPDCEQPRNSQHCPDSLTLLTCCKDRTSFITYFKEIGSDNKCSNALNALILCHTEVASVVVVTESQTEAFIADMAGEIIHVDVFTGLPINRIQGHVGPISGLQVNSIMLISAGYDGYVRFWDRHNLAPLRHLEHDMGAPIRHIFASETYVLTVALGDDVLDTQPPHYSVRLFEFM